VSHRELRNPLAATQAIARLVSRASSVLIRRASDRVLGRGLYARPLDFARDRAVLLFYEDFERDRLVPYDRQVTRALRRMYHAASKGQVASGFEVAFRSLAIALDRAGYKVIVNDHALARRNPTYPVGIAGYPQILERWKLPNPAVLGPGLLDHPSLFPDLMKDARFRSYIVPGEWMRNVFARSYGDRCAVWTAGIDTEAWADMRAEPKDIDVLVYEKILWKDPNYEASLITPLLRALDARKKKYRVIRYRQYVHAEFRALLARSRVMAFLSESETQGIAYQEAMACNVPILAWDNGWWLDRQRIHGDLERVPASSIPHFDDRCGVHFRDASGIDAAVDAVFARERSFEPRKFVEERLSLAVSAARYVELYSAAAEQ
jgi:glycosyltransferase involved in cell wall biosynthesis